MVLKSLSDLRLALENAHKAAPNPPFASDLTLPALPEAPAQDKGMRARIELADTRATRLALMAAWYEVSTPERRREPDPTREYLGPRFCPPIPRGQGRKKPFALS